jgi:hypothetical protein
MQGRICDGGVFLHSSFYNALNNGLLNLPQPSVLPGSEMPIPYVLVADDAFPITSYLMKPYAGELTKGSPKTVFNYRLSRARRIVENAFGLLASVFGIFHKPLNVKPSTVEDITLACVYLHNFLRRNSAAKQLHSPPGTLDFENIDEGTVKEGEWRREIQNDRGMVRLARTRRNPGNDAKKIRDKFMDYFMSNEGRVSWQDRYL